ncbi:MAG: glycosyltransferase [Candidatus Delongbacteria bacterium]|nr:glycosyltransferase [Candidatus Delongbacteria bacterium]MCG2759674.1 glycosyltransferase [Candidatus Delongbacteria bacterium]
MNGQKINIAFILPSLDKGGVSSVALNMISKLDSGIYSKFIILYDGNIVEYETEYEIINLKAPKKKCLITKIFTQFIRYSRLKKFKKDKKIDISISFKDNPNLTSLFSKQNDRIIMTVHTTPSRDYKGLKGKIYKFLINRYFNRADRVVTVSDGIKNDLILNYGVSESKIQTIYNFIDTGYIKRLSSEPIEYEIKHLFEGGGTVITVGRLSEAKGQHHLIRAFKYVSAEVPDSSLVIVGDGELKEYLADLIEDLCLTNRVFLIGNRDNPYKYLKHSDIFVLSSVYEGFGIVLIEAMACGLPVISTECLSGPTEILIGEAGILVPVLDGKKYTGSEPLTTEEKVLANEIIRLLKGKTECERFKELSLKRALDFSLEKIIPQWDELIHEFLKGK